MSKTQEPQEQSDTFGQADPKELVEEHRELIEKIANADIALSERCQKALDTVDGEADDE